MVLTQLLLKNFRNYSQVKLECAPKINLFYGQNAQGKTNLLEAISLLCLGKSFRTRKEAELIAWNEEVCYLKGLFDEAGMLTLIETGISEKEKKVKINGQAVKSVEAFSKIPIVSFTPDDLQLIKGGPQLRRDFLDLHLAQIEPHYRFVYYNFYKVLQQKNRLLRNGVKNLTELEIWNEELVKKGVKVVKYRAHLVDSIKDSIYEIHKEISGNQEFLELKYLSFNQELTDFGDENELQSFFRKQLTKVQPIELERGTSLIGPQRDDLLITLGKDINLRNFGSQGQQRTAVLALKLGLIKKISQKREINPILLLDDVMSEFDDDRKRFLLGLLIKNSQTFITATNYKNFNFLQDQAQIYYIAKGEVGIGTDF